MYVCSQLGVDACAHVGVCAQRLASHFIPQVLSTLPLEIGSLTGVELTDHETGLTG